MARLTSSARRRDTAAEALPVPYPVFRERGVYLRRGQLSLWAAAPGVGKSQLLHNIAHRTGAPTLYWSADTDAHDVLTRALAMWTGSTVGEVAETLSADAWREHNVSALSRSEHIEWFYEPAISGPLLGEVVKAFVQPRGQYPHLVVIDNLRNAVKDRSQEYSEQKQAMAKFQQLARETRAHIAVLSHAQGQYAGGLKPIPLGGVMYQMDQDVETCLTLHWADSTGTRVNVNPVKVRSGRPDPAAEDPIVFQVDGARSEVKGYE